MAPINVTFCWGHISGYMLACWRDLAAREGVNLSILAFSPALDAPFSTAGTEGLQLRLLDEEERKDVVRVRRLVSETKPDVIVVTGWWWPPYRRLLSSRENSGVRFIVGVDTPLRGTFRQRVGRILLRRYLSRMSLVVVPGERARRLVRYYGVPAERIKSGLYGVDTHALAKASEKRARLGREWPRAFVFVGRLAKKKGLETLLEGYRMYRELSSSPWPLTICGEGCFAKAAGEVEGVHCRGFVQPIDLPAVLGEHGVLVLASDWDPWPIVIPEACAAGLPVICTDACGASVEVVRDRYNGLVIPSRRPESLAAAMLWMELNVEELPKFGARGEQLAAPYSASEWAGRWQSFCRQSLDVDRS